MTSEQFEIKTWADAEVTKAAPPPDNLEIDPDQDDEQGVEPATEETDK